MNAISPGAGDLTHDELRAISATSCRVPTKLGHEIQWIECFVTGENTQHSAISFESNSAVATTIGPTTAEA